MPTPDAVVVGAGPNGLVAATLLADAGWDVLLLEAAAEVGGAVASDEELAPGYVHDTFSAFYPLGLASPVIRSLRLEQHGLRWRHAPAVLGHPLVGGGWALLERDRDATAAGLDAHAPGDGEAWLELCRLWDVIGDEVVGALFSPFPPVRAGARALRRLPAAGGLSFVRTVLEPVTALGSARFEGEAARLLLAGNAGHADIPADAPLSGFMGLLLSMLAQTVGYPVPEGGAGNLALAMRRRFEGAGGTVRCDAEVTRVLVRDGRVEGVGLRGGERIATSCVVADVHAVNLFGRLLDPEAVPRRVRAGMRRFQHDPGTVKVDWALDGPVPWSDPPRHAPGTVHVADSVDDVALALAQVSAHQVPAKPFLLAGQMTTADPTRSPAGTESMWAYTHVPQEVRDDGGTGVSGRWDADDLERYADRVQARVEAHAPDLASRIVARRVLGPHELEARDANLIGGALNGGTSQLHQELVFRPVPGTGRPGTGIGGLFLGSASAHPGGGVHGAAGANAARAAIAARRVRRLVEPVARLWGGRGRA